MCCQNIAQLLIGMTEIYTEHSSPLTRLSQREPFAITRCNPTPLCLKLDIYVEVKYEQWKQRLRRCVAAQGNYFEGDNLDL